jgi:hypothetical protein
MFNFKCLGKSDQLSLDDPDKIEEYLDKIYGQSDEEKAKELYKTAIVGCGSNAYMNLFNKLAMLDLCVKYDLTKKKFYLKRPKGPKLLTLSRIIETFLSLYQSKIVNDFYKTLPFDPIYGMNIRRHFLLDILDRKFLTKKRINKTNEAVDNVDWELFEEYN